MCISSQKRGNSPEQNHAMRNMCHDACRYTLVSAVCNITRTDTSGSPLVIVAHGDNKTKAKMWKCAEWSEWMQCVYYSQLWTAIYGLRDLAKLFCTCFHHVLSRRWNEHSAEAFFNFDKLYLCCKITQKNFYYILLLHFIISFYYNLIYLFIVDFPLKRFL